MKVKFELDNTNLIRYNNVNSDFRPATGQIISFQQSGWIDDTGEAVDVSEVDFPITNVRWDIDNCSTSAQFTITVSCDLADVPEPNRY